MTENIELPTIPEFRLQTTHVETQYSFTAKALVSVETQTEESSLNTCHSPQKSGSSIVLGGTSAVFAN